MLSPNTACVPKLPHTSFLVTSQSSTTQEPATALCLIHTRADGPTHLERVPADQLQPDKGVDQLGDAQRDVGFTVGVAKLELPLFKPLADQLYLCEVLQSIIKQPL